MFVIKFQSIKGLFIMVAIVYWIPFLITLFFACLGFLASLGFVLEGSFSVAIFTALIFILPVVILRIKKKTIYGWVVKRKFGLNSVGTSKSNMQTVLLPVEKGAIPLDQAGIIKFLDANNKLIGTIENFGSLIDIASIKVDFGIRVTNDFLVVERDEMAGESAGQQYEKIADAKKGDVFKYPYNLPEEFPKARTKKVESVNLSTVQTHNCAPKMQCDQCGGSGKCAVCDSRGYNRCGACDGSGKKEVRDGKYANGKVKYKKVACSKCHGSMRISCSSCNGSKKCCRCEGGGKVTCKKCNGTGLYQTYSSVHTSYEPKTRNMTYTAASEISHVLHATKNNIAFDDDLIEWKSSDQILFDKRNDAIKANKYIGVFLDNFVADAELEKNQRLGRVHTTFENVPVITIEYFFEDKEYTIYIVGGDYAAGGRNIVCFNKIPKQHVYKLNIFSKVISLITKSKRKIAFLYIASYMFNSDGLMNSQEQKLMELLGSHSDLNDTEWLELSETLKNEHTLDEISPHLRFVKNDLRAIVFAWQCVLQDKQIDEREVLAFNNLADFFRVDGVKLEKLKHKAEKIGKLNDAQLIKEYFNP